MLHLFWLVEVFRHNQPIIMNVIYRYATPILIGWRLSLQFGDHRRRTNTEEKAKVVASVWEKEFIQFLAVLAVLHLTIWIIGWIAPGWFERKGWIRPILQNRSVVKTASASRNWIFLPPKTEATTFTCSSVFVLLLWRKGLEMGLRKCALLFSSVSCCEAGTVQFIVLEQKV